MLPRFKHIAGITRGYGRTACKGEVISTFSSAHSLADLQRLHQRYQAESNNLDRGLLVNSGYCPDLFLLLPPVIGSVADRLSHYAMHETTSGWFNNHHESCICICARSHRFSTRTRMAPRLVGYCATTGRSDVCVLPPVEGESKRRRCLERSADGKRKAGQRQGHDW